MRRLLIAVLVLIALGAALATMTVIGMRAAYGQMPVTCAFPDQLDQFQSVSIGQRWTADMHNQILCALNRLEEYVLDLQAAGEGTCVAVSLTAAQRKRITVNVAHPLNGTEPVFVSAQETDNGWFEANGLEEVSGSAVVVWVFNHDAQSTRTGRVCVHVVRS